MTDKERWAVNHLQDWLRKFGGDSVTDPSSSPAGDGRWVPLLEVFPRYPGGKHKGGAQSSAQRQAIRRIHDRGELAALEVAYYGGCVKAVRYELVAEAEQTIAAMTPAERELLAK